MTKSKEFLTYLVDRNEIAHLLGVGPTAVSNYVARTSPKHPAFPNAILTRSHGRFRLWDIDDVQDWHRRAFPKREDVWDGSDQRLDEYRGQS